MKASRDPITFTPVILTLETQAEVDAIYSVLNNTRLSIVLGLGSHYESLKPFKSDEADRLHIEINKILKL